MPANSMAVNTLVIEPISKTLTASRGNCPGPGSPHPNTCVRPPGPSTPTTMAVLRFASTRSEMIRQISESGLTVPATHTAPSPDDQKQAQH